MTEERTNEARRVLDDLSATLATLGKMARDIEPSYCTDADLARIEIASSHLNDAEDLLANLCADNNEAQEDAGAQTFPFDARDMVAKRLVTITGWDDFCPGYYTARPGYLASPHEITTTFPAWYVRAQQAEADAADERATVDDVRYGGAL